MSTSHSTNIEILLTFDVTTFSRNFLNFLKEIVKKVLYLLISTFSQFRFVNGNCLEIIFDFTMHNRMSRRQAPSHVGPAPHTAAQSLGFPACCDQALEQVRFLPLNSYQLHCLKCSSEHCSNCFPPYVFRLEKLCMAYCDDAFAFPGFSSCCSNSCNSCTEQITSSQYRVASDHSLSFFHQRNQSS